MSIFPGGQVHKVLGQPVAQIGAGLYRGLAVCATESWRILYKGKTAKSTVLLGLLLKLKNTLAYNFNAMLSPVLGKEENKIPK